MCGLDVEVAVIIVVKYSFIIDRSQLCTVWQVFPVQLLSMCMLCLISLCNIKFSFCVRLYLINVMLILLQISLHLITVIFTIPNCSSMTRN